MIINGREIPDATFRVFKEAVYDAMDRLVEAGGEKPLTLLEALAAVIGVALADEADTLTDWFEPIAGNVEALIVATALEQRDATGGVRTN